MSRTYLEDVVRFGGKGLVGKWEGKKPTPGPSQEGNCRGNSPLFIPSHLPTFIPHTHPHMLSHPYCILYLPHSDVFCSCFLVLTKNAASPLFGLRRSSFLVPRSWFGSCAAVPGSWLTKNEERGTKNCSLGFNEELRTKNEELFFLLTKNEEPKNLSDNYW